MACVDSSAPEASRTPDSRWQPVFEIVLRRILAEYHGTEAKVKDGMESGMRKLFEKPYQEELGRVRQREPLELEEAQRIVFCPLLSDMQWYTQVFSRDTPEATARREQLMKFKLMSVFYTVHRADATMMEKFIHFGGLKSLADLLCEDHRVIQSQAVELLQELVAPFMEMTPATSSRQLHLHYQVYDCFRSDSFWRYLGRIIQEPGEVFPKSHSCCVRLMAGAIGWLRPPPEVIPEAGSLPDFSEAILGLQRVANGIVQLAPDVRGFAEELLAELVGGPLLRPAPMKGEALEEAKKAIFAKEALSREDAAHSWQLLRALGNEAFGASLIWPAEAAYRLALEQGGRVIPSTEASLICSNRSLALLKAGHFQEAAEAAADALAKDPRNAKAAYRRAQALLQQCRSGDVTSTLRALAKEALAAAEVAASLEPKDAKVAETLATARRRVDELGPEECPEVAASSPLTTGLDDMD